MLRLKVSSALLFGLLLASATSFTAQPPAGTLQPLRGTIQRTADDHLQLKVRNGQQLTARLTGKAVVHAMSLAKPGGIQPDSLIDTAAVPQPNGTLKALEVHIFAPSLRGSGGGHRPWENADSSTSTTTNDTVGNLVVSQGRCMTVKYGDGEKTMVVPDDVPIASLEPGERNLLKPGIKVVLLPQKGASGSLTALTISVGKDDVTPPMRDFVGTARPSRSGFLGERP